MENAPQETAEEVASSYLGIDGDPQNTPRHIKRYLGTAAILLLVTPLLFWLSFGEVGPLGWGLTVFLVVYCLLVALGLFLRLRPEYQTKVGLRGNWLDMVGALWLVACAFGPFFSWVLVSFIPLTEGSWRWQYGGQILLSIVLPVLTGLTLLRYVRGRGALIMLALLLGITSLPVMSAWNSLQDLLEGPVERRAGEYLVHTGHWLED
jgi:hypothetical protein